jgi:murein L,D-transpeptidase YafK
LGLAGDGSSDSAHGGIQCLSCRHRSLASLSEWSRLSSRLVREIVWLLRLRTVRGRLLVSTTDQVRVSRNTGHLPARRHTDHLLARTHMGHLPVPNMGHLPAPNMGRVPAPPEAPLTCSDKRAGKTLRLSEIASVFAKTCFSALIVACFGGCSTTVYAPKTTVRTGTVRTATLKQMETLNMDRAAPILVRIYKEESTLEVWKQDRSGNFALLNSYPICKFSGNLGPKLMQGDHQAPEGFYDITPDQMNPNSSEYLAFNTGFPNAYDRSLGRTGSFLMVHGGCRSVGCYAMTDYAMEEIYGLVDDAFKGGQQKVQLQAFPFRMTAQNLASHAGDPNIPFWEMLKAGSDAFLATERPPRVAVCDRRYIFNPAVAGEFDPSAPCPTGIESTAIASAPQPSREASASAVPPNTGVIAYRTVDPIAQKIKESLRGIY